MIAVLPYYTLPYLHPHISTLSRSFIPLCYDVFLFLRSIPPHLLYTSSLSLHLSAYHTPQISSLSPLFPFLPFFPVLLPLCLYIFLPTLLHRFPPCLPFFPVLLPLCRVVLLYYLLTLHFLPVPIPVTHVISACRSMSPFLECLLSGYPFPRACLSAFFALMSSFQATLLQCLTFWLLCTNAFLSDYFAPMPSFLPPLLTCLPFRLLCSNASLSVSIAPMSYYCLPLTAYFHFCLLCFNAFLSSFFDSNAFLSTFFDSNAFFSASSTANAFRSASFALMHSVLPPLH